MNNDAYRQQWLKYKSGYERRAYTIMRKAMSDTVNRLPINNITYDNYKTLIPVNVNTYFIRNAYLKIYRQIGLIHGTRVGGGINRELKDFSRPLFNEEFQKTIADWVAENCGTNIISVTDTIANRIIGLVEKSLLEQLTLQQMQSFIRKNLDSTVLNKYEVMRIVRTETTAAANHSAIVAGETSGIVLVKRWISSQTERTRIKPRDDFDHFHMNGKEVGQDEKFTMRGKGGTINEMDFPGDPKGSAENVIQCRCAIALVPKRDSEGFVIRK